MRPVALKILPPPLVAADGAPLTILRPAQHDVVCPGREQGQKSTPKTLSLCRTSRGNRSPDCWRRPSLAPHVCRSRKCRWPSHEPQASRNRPPLALDHNHNPANPCPACRPAIAQPADTSPISDGDACTLLATSHRFACPRASLRTACWRIPPPLVVSLCPTLDPPRLPPNGVPVSVWRPKYIQNLLPPGPHPTHGPPRALRLTPRSLYEPFQRPRADQRQRPPKILTNPEKNTKPTTAINTENRKSLFSNSRKLSPPLFSNTEATDPDNPINMKRT